MDFDIKLKHINQIVASYKTERVEAKKKLICQKKKKKSKKSITVYDFLLGRKCFTGDDS